MKKQIREQDIYYFDSGEQEDTALCAGMLRQMIAEIMRRENRKGVLLFCIGTDRSTGDSLGPLIGHKLKRAGLKDRRITVVGTLDSPVHAMNLEQAIFMVQHCYPDHVIVAVDASVGQTEHVGCITLGKGALRPGLGVCKELQEVGDIFITGIVGGYGNYDPLMLQSVRLSVVMADGQIPSARASARHCCRNSILFVEEFFELSDRK